MNSHHTLDSNRRPPPSFPLPGPVALLAAAALLVAACASGPDVGVRTDFEEHRLTTVAIVPFYASGSFGLDALERQDIQQRYQDAAAEALRDQGFEVLHAGALRDHLANRDRWDQFDDGIHLRQPLKYYFEPDSTDDSPSIEVQTLIDLADDDAFPVEALLFGEVVYHSPGTCREKADDHTSYAQLSITASAPAELPRPCISSHFQAKLVDVHTGQTMWFNRMFVETHTRHIDEDVTHRTIIQTVESTLEAEDGIGRLAPAKHDDAHAESP